MIKRDRFLPLFQEPVVKVAAQPVAKQGNDQGPGCVYGRFSALKAEEQIEAQKVKGQKNKKTCQFYLSL